jgi:hypothetical protein
MQEALRAARLGLSMDEALSNPLLRMLLTNHAEALAQRQADLSQVRRHAGSVDWKSRAAGNND